MSATLNKIVLFLQKSTKRKSVLIMALSAIFLSSVIFSYLFFGRRSKPVGDPVDAAEDLTPVEVEDHEVDLSEKSTLTVLLLGYGGAGHQGGFLADAIQLAHLDFEKNELSLISIPRDLWVKLPNGSQAKINQALTMGADRSDLVYSGGKVAKKMAEVVTGLEIDYFIAADFVGFKRVIGEDLGSITVDVPETLEDKWYPIHGEELNPCDKSPEEIAKLTQQLSGFELERQFECRYEHLYFSKGINQMEGGDALAYVRSRHGSAGGDFSRSQRQHALLLGVRNKLFELEFWTSLPALFNKLSKNITTDIDLEAVEYLLPMLKLVNDYELKTGVISTDNVLSSGKSSAGAFILVPKEGVNDWGQVHDYVLKTIK